MPNFAKILLPAGAAFAVYKFIPNQAVKGAALGVLGIVIAAQLPVIGPAIQSVTTPNC